MKIMNKKYKLDDAERYFFVPVLIFIILLMFVVSVGALIEGELYFGMFGILVGILMFICIFVWVGEWVENE